MFVTTANTMDMPQPLLDRMEIIRLEGYTEDEKVEIAKRHLIAKQIESHGLKEGEFIFTEDGPARPDPLLYPRGRRAHARARDRQGGPQGASPDPGRARRRASTVTADNLGEFAGVRRFRHGMGEEEDQIGAVTGLAWTEVGGELLTIEAVTVPGKGQIKTTGKLGDVMQESIQAAFSLRQGARARATASSRACSAARTSTSTCPKARCRRTARRPASAWSPRSSRP